MLHSFYNIVVVIANTMLILYINTKWLEKLLNVLFWNNENRHIE